MLRSAAVPSLYDPSQGLAPPIAPEIGALLRRLWNMGTTVRLVEQDLRFCLDITSGAVIIDKGCVVWHGSMATSSANEVSACGISRYRIAPMKGGRAE